MEVAREALARLVDRCRDVLQQHLSCGVHLLEALSGFLQVCVRVLQLPDQARRKTCFLQDPSILAGETFAAPGVVSRDEAEALVSRPPWDGDRAVDIELVEHEAKVA